MLDTTGKLPGARQAHNVGLWAVQQNKIDIMKDMKDTGG